MKKSFAVSFFVYTITKAVNRYAEMGVRNEGKGKREKEELCYAGKQT